MKPDNLPGNLLNPQSWNLYSYCNNNPVNFNDPMGHMAKWSEDPKELKEQRSMFDWLASIPGAPWTDAETGTIPGSGSVNVNLTVPVYFDQAMQLTPAERAQEFSTMRSHLLGEAFETYGAIGIDLEFINGGEVTFAPGKGDTVHVTPLDGALPIRPGSLIIVRTNYPYGGCYAKGVTGFLPDGKTPVIVVRPESRPGTVAHEFLHAFGWTSKKLGKKVYIQLADFFGLMDLERHLLLNRGIYVAAARQFASSQGM